MTPSADLTIFLKKSSSFSFLFFPRTLNWKTNLFIKLVHFLEAIKALKNRTTYHNLLLLNQFSCSLLSLTHCINGDRAPHTQNDRLPHLLDCSLSAKILFQKKQPKINKQKTPQTQTSNSLAPIDNTKCTRCAFHLPIRQLLPLTV